MQSTRFTDYGLRALIFLASLPEGKTTSITEMTDVYGVSCNDRVNVINQLSRAGLINAVRGKNGGIRRGCDPATIRISCVARTGTTDLVQLRPRYMSHNFRLPSEAGPSSGSAEFLQEPDSYTLADRVKENPPLHQLLLAEKASLSATCR
ncbi:Rrf2 family transcriptional regulator [Lonsdalea quercina]|uniref:Rrf2 family transcriptional regulator n=1 Tax=Lonsdalea quercina TaxID=71657 RepID=UPI00397669DA